MLGQEGERLSFAYAAAITQIRTATSHDVDTQVTDAQLSSWLDQEVAQLRRTLIGVAPQLYQYVSANQTPTTNSWFVLSTLSPVFERVWRLERLYGSIWRDVDVADESSPDAGCLTYRETTEAGTPILRLSPSTEALGGTYRLTYHSVPTANVVDVPGGCEDICIQRVAARVALRLHDDHRPYLELADRVWAEQKKALRKRYGAQPQPGLRLTKGW